MLVKCSESKKALMFSDLEGGGTFRISNQVGLPILMKLDSKMYCSIRNGYTTKRVDNSDFEVFKVEGTFIEE